MFNKILVLAPLHNIGTTSVTCGIAHTLAIRGISTTLLYTDTKNDLAVNFGLGDVDASPSNISMIASTMTERSLNSKVILEYSHKIPSVDNLHILNVGSTTIDSYSRDLVLNLILDKLPTQVCIVDVAEGLEDERIQDLIEKVDCIFVVLIMSQECINLFNNWMESGLLPQEKVFPIVNYYNENVMPIQKFAALINLLPSRMNKVHYNAFITRCTLMQAMYELVPQIEKKDPRVAQLSGDFDRIYSTILDAYQEKRFAFNLEDSIAKVKSKLNMT